MVNAQTSLFHFVKVYKQAINLDACEYITNYSDHTWSKHEWMLYDTVIEPKAREKEFDVSYVKDRIIKLMLNDPINQSLENYCYDFKFSIKTHTNPRINKYNTGNLIETHFDHITSIFNESKKGIPVLSIVGLLNNNFEGGKFYLWDDTEIELEAGDILVFPSVFMYPHKVSTVTEGTRWSFVSWAY